MDWLKSILESLPLEKISDILGEIVIWWSQMVKGVPPADLPMYAYIGGAVIVLALWILVARMLPRPFGGMSWIVLFAVLLAPGSALDNPSLLAPASISVVYAVMMKDSAAAVNSALPIMVVLVLGLFIGFIWQLIRGAFETSLDKARLHTAQDSELSMQLAGDNHLSDHIVSSDSDSQTNKEPVTRVSTLKKVEPVKPNVIKQNKSSQPLLLSAPKKKIEGFYSNKKSSTYKKNELMVVDTAKEAKKAGTHKKDDK